jgi:flagellar biosynthesis activator protein FlaF
MSIHKYQAAHVETASPLSVEVMAFNRVTAALEQCAHASAKGRPADATQRIQQHVRLCDAVYQNSRLWIAILDDLISPENRLAQDMKQRLASLGATSLTHGRKILAGQATPQLLIDINRAILTGLAQARETKFAPAANVKEVAHASRQA